MSELKLVTGCKVPMSQGNTPEVSHRRLWGCCKLFSFGTRHNLMWWSQLPGRAALSLCLLDSCMQSDRKPWQVMAVHVAQKMQCLGLKCAIHLLTAFTFTSRMYSVRNSLSGYQECFCIVC